MDRADHSPKKCETCNSEIADYALRYVTRAGGDERAARFLNDFKDSVAVRARDCHTMVNVFGPLALGCP